MGAESGSYANLTELASAASLVEANVGEASPGFVSIGPTFPVTWGFHNLSPSQRIYIRPNDVVAISVTNQAQAINIVIGLQVLRSDGQLAQLRFDIAPSVKAGSQNFHFALTEGFLFSVAAFTNDVCLIGQCFVTLGIQPDASASPVLRPIQLVAAYIGEGVIASWPQGRLRTPRDGRGWLHVVAGTQPAAGAECIEIMPAVSHREIRGVHLRLQTSAAVANRQIVVQFDDTVNAFFTVTSTYLQVAGQLVHYYVAGNGLLSANVLGNVNLPMPERVPLEAGWALRTVTANIQAGDQYFAPAYLVEEWQGD